MSLAKAAQRCVESLEHELQRVKNSLRRQGFSHSSEERILSKYIADLLPRDHSQTVVDIGASNGVRWSNTYSLFQKGWKGVGIEADGERFSRLARAYKNLTQAHACHSTADPDNIVPLLRSLGVESGFSVLSLDIDLKPRYGNAAFNASQTGHQIFARILCNGIWQVLFGN